MGKRPRNLYELAAGFFGVLLFAACSSPTAGGDPATGVTAIPTANALEVAAQELLPPDATVMERADCGCPTCEGVPSCEFILFVRRDVPIEHRLADAKERIESLGWTISYEEHFDQPGQAGGVLLEMHKGTRAARWWIKSDEWNARCFDGTLSVSSCSGTISMY